MQQRNLVSENSEERIKLIFTQTHFELSNNKQGWEDSIFLIDQIFLRRDIDFEQNAVEITFMNLNSQYISLKNIFKLFRNKYLDYFKKWKRIHSRFSFTTFKKKLGKNIWVK